MADNFDFVPAREPAAPQASGYDFTPVHEFNYGPIAATTAQRDELANMWLSKRDNIFGGPGPQTPQELEAIQAKATAAGLTIDEVMAAAAEKSPSDAGAINRYRYGGPLTRGYAQGVNSAVVGITNVGLRGLSYIPGYEHLSTKADENNRALDTAAMVRERLDREGSLGELITPGAAAMIGSVATGLTEVGLVAAVPIGGGAAVAEGATAEATVAAAKASQLAASKKMALYFGMRQGEQALTAGTDAGLSPNMRLANAGVSAAIASTFTYGAGAWAQSLGLQTTEQAVAGLSPAVARLLEREGLTKAAAGVVLSGGEQAAQELAQMQWGSLVGTDTTDDGFNRALKAFETGAIMRGTPEVLPAMKNFHDTYIRTQEKVPETVKGAVAAQKVIFEGAKPVDLATEKPAFVEAYNSEMEALKSQKAEVEKTLASIDAGGESLKARIEKLLAAKKEMQVATDDNGLTPEARAKLKEMEFSDEAIAEATTSPIKAGARSTETGKPVTSEVNAEQAAIRAERDKLVEQRKEAEFKLKELEQAMAEMSDADKEAVKSKVVENLDAVNAKQILEQERVNLTRAENELNAKFRAQEGYEKLPDSEWIPIAESLRRARAAGLVQRADDIAKEIVQSNSGLTYDKQNAMLEARLHRGDTIKEANAIVADPAASETAKRDAQFRITDSRKSEDIITRALKTGRADVARTLGTGQYDVDHLKPNVVRETGRKAKGSDLTAAEADGLTKGAEGVSDIEHRMRRVAEEKPVKGPLSREGFTFRETLRAEQRKGSALTKAEADAVAAKARHLYDQTADIHILDAAKLAETADDLYVAADKARTALEAQVLALEPKTFGRQAQFASGLLREWLTTGELAPANLRAGILYPSLWPSALKKYWRALTSERAATLYDRDLKKGEYYTASQEGDVKVRYMERHSPYEFQEGGMAQQFFSKFPLLRRFSDANRTAVNHFRQGAFKILVDSEGGLSKWNTEGLNRVKEFVNTGTGHGTLGKFEASASALSDWMLAPRFFFSRLQYFTGWPMFKAAYAGDKMATKVMLKTYAKQVAGLAAMTAIAEVAGKAAYGPDEVEFFRNPADFNFGRLRIGSTLIDITGGLAKPFRYATSLAEPLVAKYQDRPALKRAGPTLLGIGRSALAPVPSALVSAAEVYATGKDANGEMQKYIFPWSWSDSVKAMMDEGMDKGSAIAALNMFGAGSYTTERNK